MKKHKQTFPTKIELKEYTLFLDRDGVINEPKIDDYVKTDKEFIFTKEAIKTIQALEDVFKYIIVVTNQQGIGRKLMSEQDLENVHLKMYNGLRSQNVGFFDAVYYAPYLRIENHQWRKPSNGMVQKAFQEFEIDPSKCIVVGDSPGDMALAETINAWKVKIANKQFDFDNQHLIFETLSDFGHFIAHL